MVKEEDIDQYHLGKGLPHSFPVLLEEGKDITIEDIERIVDKATNLGRDEHEFKQFQEE